MLVLGNNLLLINSGGLSSHLRPKLIHIDKIENLGTISL